jgi:hypothetical protein
LKTDEPPKKRRKILDPNFEDKDGQYIGAVASGDWDMDLGMDLDIGVGFRGNVQFAILYYCLTSGLSHLRRL